MSKKFLVMFLAVVVGLFAASSAMARSYGDIGWDTRNPATGSTAGTILNPEGKGDLLIFPYYDVRPIGGKAQDTYFAIINETDYTTCDTGTYEGIAAKLRFREWDKSLEVYDVDIWLSCHDVWVGLITRDASKNLAQLWSPDYVIIGHTDAHFVVSKPLDVKGPGGELIGRPFRPDVIPIPNSRTLYGYFEVIGEERTASKTHSAGGETRVNRNREDAPNWLMGYAFIVRVDDGVSAGYNATAIANFSRNQGSLYSAPGGELPTLLQCEDTIDQLEFELSKYNLYQGYSIEDVIKARWSMIVTFPTKHFHFGLASPFSRNNNTDVYVVPFLGVWVKLRPRGEPFIGDTANKGEPVNIWLWDRHENKFEIPPGFESPQREDDKKVLPYELNIIGLYKGTGAPALTNPRDNVGFSSGTFDSGWIWIQFTDQAKDLTWEAGTSSWGGNQKLQLFNHLGNLFYLYRGLPAIALIFQEFANDTVGVGAAYGEILPAFYKVDWYWD